MSRITARAFKPSENFFRRARLTGITQRKFSIGSASIAKTLRRHAFRKQSNVIRNNLNVNQMGVSWLSSTTDNGMFMDDFGDRKLKERHDYYDVSDKVVRELRQQEMRLSRVVSQNSDIAVQSKVDTLEAKRLAFRLSTELPRSFLRYFEKGIENNMFMSEPSGISEKNIRKF